MDIGEIERVIRIEPIAEPVELPAPRPPQPDTEPVPSR